VAGVVATAGALIPAAPVDVDAVTWERAIVAWEARMESADTRRTYTATARALARTPGVPPLHLVDVGILDAYAGALRARTARDAPPGRRLAPATANVRLAAVRSFLAFCRLRGWLSPALTRDHIADALRGVRATVRRPYEAVAGGDVTALLDGAAAAPYEAARSYALIALGLGAGLRVAELVALDAGDMRSDGEHAYVDVRAGKGRKDRQVPIARDVEAACLAYLDSTGRSPRRTRDRETPLFLSRKRQASAGRLTTGRARALVAEAAQRAGLLDAGRRITPHALRHSYALRLLLGDAEAGQEGAPLPAVSKLLGHSSVAVTGRYLDHFERRDLARYAPALSRRDGKGGGDADHADHAGDTSGTAG
jgi:site-specific recombinase XerD